MDSNCKKWIQIFKIFVGGDMSELNAHTYVYQPDKSLQGFTIEVKK